jgi:hypothetical protein
MSTKKSPPKAPAKQHILFAAPCCAKILDLELTGTVFGANINGTQFNNITTIRLSAEDPMMFLGMTKKGVFQQFKPWKIFVTKGKPGQNIVVKDGVVKALKSPAKKAPPKKK